MLGVYPPCIFHQQNKHLYKVSFLYQAMNFLYATCVILRMRIFKLGGCLMSVIVLEYLYCSSLCISATVSCWLVTGIMLFV
jgi:hypothetical protein